MGKVPARPDAAAEGAQRISRLSHAEWEHYRWLVGSVERFRTVLGDQEDQETLACETVAIVPPSQPALARYELPAFVDRELITPIGVSVPEYDEPEPSPDRRRFPVSPLMALSGAATMSEFSRLLGVHNSQVIRWKRYGIGAVHADRCAVTLSMHPSEIWEDWYETALVG